MLVSCKAIESQQNDLSVLADEDMLENTKPNLISYSLSTSSSNHTTVSITTNSDQHGVEAEHTTGCKYSDVGMVASFDSPKAAENAKTLSPFHATQISTFVDTSDCTNMNITFNEVSKSTKSFTRVHNSIRTENECSYTDSACEVPYRSTMRKNFVSMNNLSTVDHSNNELPRFASHPQLNSPMESINQASESSITLKNRSRTYGHIQSKVKHYIQQLKSENVVSSESVSTVEENSQPELKDVSIVDELQQEIRKLQICLEERDTLLQEVQANHHSLLLQYGEAKNRLDHLRFTSMKPQQGIKSVQTEPYSISDKISNCTLDIDKYILPITQEKLEHDMGIEGSEQHFTSICPEERKSNTLNLHGNPLRSDALNVQHQRTNLKEKDQSGFSLRRNKYSPDMALLKVSTWFTSLPRQPLPVPSCYGSLGSSGSVSNHPQDSHGPALELLNNPPPLNLTDEDVAPVKFIEQYNCLSVVDQYQKSSEKNYDVRNGWSREQNVAQESETYFLPIDRCFCWTPDNIPEYDPMKLGLLGNYPKSDMEDILLETCVPPLNLECSKDSIVPLQDGNSISENTCLSEVSLSSRLCGSSCSQNSIFQRPYSKEARHHKHKIYLDTPTSYKSIMINCTQERSNDKDRRPVSLSHDAHVCRKSELHSTSTDCDKTSIENNWKMEDLQASCCLQKIIESQRYFIDHSHKCCCYKETLGRILRCEECISKDPKKTQDSEVLPDVLQFLNNMSACAEELRRRSEAIEIFLTHLVEAASESHQ